MAENQLREHLEDWPVFLRGAGKAEATVKTYTAGVKRFFIWCDEQGIEPELDPRTVSRFTADLLSQGQEATTVHGRQLAVRRFSAWLKEESLIDKDNLVHMAPVKKPVKVIEPLTDEELKAMLSAAKGTGLAERRDEALLRLMIETGLRAGEAVELRAADVDIQRQTVIVRRSKTGKGRIVGFSPKTAAAIARYMRIRRAHLLADNGELWLGARGKRFTYFALHARLAKLAQKAGVQDFHPHRLRHTAAHRWLAAGGSDSGLLAMAGWQRPEMLLRYTSARAQQRAQDEAKRLNLGDL
jgi:integrase/recombinase XerD